MEIFLNLKNKIQNTDIGVVSELAETGSNGFYGCIKRVKIDYSCQTD